MDATRELYSLNLLVKQTVLLHQILFNLVIAAIADSILLQISAVQVPSLRRVAFRYLKLVPQLLPSTWNWPVSWPGGENVTTKLSKCLEMHDLFVAGCRWAVTYNCWLVCFSLNLIVFDFHLQSELKVKAEQATLAAKAFSDLFYQHLDTKRHVGTQNLL